jgi:predicted RNase H-like nuclease (RuvC/YqgF family)
MRLVKMTDREKMLELLDEFKNSIVKLMDEREGLNSEAEELRTARREAEEKTWAAEEKVKELTSKLEDAEKVKDDLAAARKEIEELEAKANEAEASKSEAEDTLRRERDDLKKEMDEITGQLTRVSELYREASAEKEALQEKVDVSDLLAIYITLIETVFYGKPHARILYTLHDVKSAITRKNIVSSTGIQPAVVLKAVHELAAADLVSYDENTQEVQLTKDILRRSA